MVGASRAWRRSRHLGRTLLLYGALWAPLAALSSSPLAAQVSPQQAAQQLQQNAALVRQRLQQSGLSPEQVRSRLQSAGYPSDLLDAYMDPTAMQGAGPEPTASMVEALNALVPPSFPAQGLESMQPRQALEPSDSLQALRDSLRLARGDSLPLFGLDVFRGRTTQFQPLLTGPVPPNYRIGPGDQMVLVITGDVEFIHELVVTREGFVVIPQVGQLFVNDLTMEQLNALLRERLGRSYSGVRTGTTRFDVTISRLRTNQVFVIGEVVEPGAYQLASVATILNGLYAAGGPTERGNFRSVRLQRFGQTIAELDLYEYLLAGDTQNDLMLQQGDVVFVPPRDVRVRIEGAVLRPAIYDLRPDEDLRDLIEYAGGVTQAAALHRARITRVVPAGERTVPGVDRTVFDVNLSEVVRDSAAALLPLEQGDAVRVFEVSEEVRNTVTLEGQVWYPGEFGYRPGMTAWDLIRRGQGLQPEAYLDRAHIVRLDQASNTYSVIPFSLDTTAAGEPTEDPSLDEYDVVRVFSLEQFVDSLPVTISGEVRNAHSETFVEGMTLRDLILRAGGVTAAADLTVEIARVEEPEARAAGAIAQVSRVRIDSSYVVPDARGRFYLGSLDSLGTNGGAAAAFELRPYDHVFVRRLPFFEEPRVVRVLGEVQYPGAYALQRKDETLREVIERTGGLKITAFPGGFRFYRDGRLVNIDLSGVLEQDGHEDNVVLQPGDSMVVPEYNPVVRVAGAVVSQGADILYQPGAGLSYYIERAGGYSRLADTDRVAITYANGETRIKRGFLFFFSRTPDPGPGSTIFVGTKPEPEPFNVTQFLGTVAQIAASTVAIVVVATR